MNTSQNCKLFQKNDKIMVLEKQLITSYRYKIIIYLYIKTYSKIIVKCISDTQQIWA